MMPSLASYQILNHVQLPSLAHAIAKSFKDAVSHGSHRRIILLLENLPRWWLEADALMRAVLRSCLTDLGNSISTHKFSFPGHRNIHSNQRFPAEHRYSAGHESSSHGHLSGKIHARVLVLASSSSPWDVAVYIYLSLMCRNQERCFGCSRATQANSPLGFSNSSQRVVSLSTSLTRQRQFLPNCRCMLYILYFYRKRRVLFSEAG